jgi:hypothetical protein
MRFDKLDIALKQGGIVKIYLLAFFFPQMGKLLCNGVFQLRHIHGFAGEQIPVNIVFGFSGHVIVFFQAPFEAVSLANFALRGFQRGLDDVDKLFFLVFCQNKPFSLSTPYQTLGSFSGFVTLTSSPEGSMTKSPFFKA